ncbi:similar to Saccharomyces cerevisiae YJL116C NCA3 Protein that functions with Nca2p to regulate mitochondrial expression of subunits 6 (Atp6p) and 8 (Atp8p) of the Fo-F1 ATP synthase [Maudiozyma barnettii]|uniref:Similar to Saccharomyces cerevisiae YJL116C NCA3 Protein that functions with Nca2p to regulate mitochondrial expression of subunits 6 (Atp6p) and 8 (Atp8p ) of the Fo-F1 ATP synthase n=1 Tax=Maudiozyma barnettii TaxID=61262 RepID=A0A8H2VAZ1_9SACH|nr:SUN family protein NCA3 [Kazachstania barnettii]CAB4251940.1 similar to Saccharomyces cerevisiae YJL116C NCA3 Protein that functions with Nca2p to regulate mitochondrial expression of subunits 6 (Atp6p) and 8 (Atp8p) of the Fo-F1 ATP synthase [Kazachstania barnettii]CAD1778301.1 similar to Saccharomyces cerevisiae YJL116C NCA3 Protein that functions with Nca2p to regulate mitochondrial expression of subunits 6 (Atp6p) and 8 (Atp8p) of the Fo-F1 ATP synthase [Kazachstania barnettii]
MKFSTALTISSIASVAIAAPRGDHHSDVHFDKRGMVTVTQYVNENGAVIIPGAGASASETSSVAVATATLAGASTASSKTTTTLSPSASTGVSSSSSSSGDYSGDLTGSSTGSKFEDGTIACSSFPSGSGVISLDWLGLSGWSSIQDSDGNSVTSCEDGSYCSYACQAGMSKTQWPSSQPDSGASLGGLVCKDGYLFRTNTDTDYLCGWGEGTASASNSNSNGGIALCRTDYPGSEAMVVPTWLESGSSSKQISVVNEETYYQWEGKQTSAQYYVNNAGVSVEDGCIWGSSGSDVGNWAPLVLGAGSADGITYLSLIPNPNNEDATSANFNVKIVATDGSTVSGDCSFENGEFSTDGGCTVSVTSGSAEFQFY